MQKSILYTLILLCLFQMKTMAQDIEQIAKEDPWSWTGSIGTNANIYGVSGIEKRSNPFFWNVTANMNGKVYGINLPFRLTVGQHDFTFSRPFLQLGASPSYKWAKVHLGTRSLTFSPYTLAGHSFDGVGVELTPKKLRFAAMTGRFRRAREYDPETDLRFYPALYKRTGHAVKIGYGTNDNYFDLIYLKAKDDPNSISVLPPDTLVTPSENAVLGFSAKLRLSKNIGFFADGAASAFTRDIFSKETQDYIEPDISSFFTTRYSTRLNYALKSGFSFDFSTFGIRLSYERIMPQFETMGAYFFANDREIFSVAPRFSLFNRTVNINGNIGLQRNNLLNNRSQRTQNLTGMLNLTYFNPKGFGVSANYTNLSVKQFEGLSEVIDTFQVSLVTANVSIAPMYSWTDSSRTQAIVLSAIYQELNDRNPFTREFTDMNTTALIGNYTMTFIRTGFGLNFGANYTVIDIYNLKTDRYGGTLGLTQAIADYKYNLNLTNTFNLTSVNGESDGSVISSNLTIGFNPGDKHSFSLFINVLRNNSAQFDDYTEFYGGMSYVFRIR